MSGSEPTRNCAATMIVGAIAAMKMAHTLNMSALRRVANDVSNLNNRSRYVPISGAAVCATVAATIIAGPGREGLMRAAKNAAHAIGIHILYPRKRTAANAIPAGGQMTAGDVSIT